MKQVALIIGAIATLSAIALPFLTPQPCKATSCGECSTLYGGKGILVWDAHDKAYRCSQCDGRLR